MSIFTQQFLSTKPNGGLITITSTSAPGDLVHTAPATDIDHVWLWAAPVNNNDVELYLRINNEASIRLKILKDGGPVPVLAGEPLSGSTTIHAYASDTNRAVLFGSVDRIAASGTVSVRKFTRQFLSASTSGRPIPINVIGTPPTTGVTVHTAHATATDNVWLTLSPRIAQDDVCYVYVGSDKMRIQLLKDLGPIRAFQGIPFTNGTVITAYAESAIDRVSAHGGVDRIA